jgi:hypothetical protein
VSFYGEDEGRLGAKTSRGQGLDPLAMEVFWLMFALGEEVIDGFELPTAFEIFAVESFAEFFDESFRFFVDRFVAHLVMTFFY